jgi:Family of unknown function (DUF5989)
MNKDFTGPQWPEVPRHADQRACPLAGSFGELGVGPMSPPGWMQAHLTECLSCLNDFTRLQSLGAGRAPVEDGRLQIVQELGAFMLEHKKLWLLPIVMLLALFGGLAVMTQGRAVAPVVYTLW